MGSLRLLFLMSNGWSKLVTQPPEHKTYGSGPEIDYKKVLWPIILCGSNSIFLLVSLRFSQIVLSGYVWYMDKEVKNTTFILSSNTVIENSKWFFILFKAQP